MKTVTRPVASLPRPPGRDYISYSAISTYQTCPLRFYFRYILGLPEETVSASLVFGSAIHACLQWHFEQVFAGREPPTLDVLLDVFQDAWRERQGQRIIFNKGEDINTTGRLADRMLRAFQASALANPRGRIICVEEELRGELSARLPDLLARVDLVIDEGECLSLTDFKTARTLWSREHVAESASQLLLYHELIKDLAAGRPVKLTFALLTKTKLPSVAVYPLEVDVKQIERTRAIVERIWRAIEAGHFFPRPSAMNCSRCPFQGPCQRWPG